MPAKSEKQKKFFGAVKGAKKGQKNVSGAAKKASKEMTEDQVDDFIKDEDEEKISKKIEKDGKATFKGPKVKERKKYAPLTKAHKPKKGKGSYDRNENLDENTDINEFVKHIFDKNYAAANKYINNAIAKKVQKRIEQEFAKPLF
jgi:stalled ribosome alternative rescue factor ArfA